MTDEQIFTALNELYDRESKGYQTSLEYGGQADENQEKYLGLLGDTINYITRLINSDADKERYTIELYNRAKEAEREVKEWQQKFINFDKFGDMTTPIGILPINTDGMRKLVDGCLELRKETAKEILKKWWREATVGRKETDKRDGTELWYIKKVAEEYGVEVDE